AAGLGVSAPPPARPVTSTNAAVSLRTAQARVSPRVCAARHGIDLSLMTRILLIRILAVPPLPGSRGPISGVPLSFRSVSDDHRPLHERVDRAGVRVGAGLVEGHLEARAGLDRTGIPLLIFAGSCVRDRVRVG